MKLRKLGKTCLPFQCLYPCLRPFQLLHESLHLGQPQAFPAADERSIPYERLSVFENTGADAAFKAFQGNFRNHAPPKPPADHFHAGGDGIHGKPGMNSVQALLIHPSQGCRLQRGIRFSADIDLTFQRYFFQAPCADDANSLPAQKKPRPIPIVVSPDDGRVQAALYHLAVQISALVRSNLEPHPGKPSVVFRQNIRELIQCFCCSSKPPAVQNLSRPCPASFPFFVPFHHHTRKQHVCEVQRAAFPFISSTAILCKDVVTVTTPGDCVDVLVTDYGIAVNPLRPDIQKCLDNAGIPTVSIQSLAASPRFSRKRMDRTFRNML